MIDNDLLEIKRETDKLKRLVKNALENYSREGFENQKIYHELEQHFENELADIVNYINYMQKEPKEYRLKLQSDGRYETNDEKYYFTSGSGIEVYVNNEVGWCTGRVECRHDEGKSIYYFLNDDDRNIDLYEGMKIRVRY